MVLIFFVGLYWDEITDEDYVIEYWDVNSLYPDQARKQLFPIGIPESIVNKTRLRNIEIKNGEMLLENQPITGILHVSILPSVSLFPFLIQNIENKVYGACCNTCLINKSKKVCKHSDKQRTITGIYTIPEIVFAVEKCGYQITEIHEVLAYK